MLLQCRSCQPSPVCCIPGPRSQQSLVAGRPLNLKVVTALPVSLTGHRRGCFSSGFARAGSEDPGNSSASNKEVSLTDEFVEMQAVAPRNESGQMMTRDRWHRHKASLARESSPPSAGPHVPCAELAEKTGVVVEDLSIATGPESQSFTRSKVERGLNASTMPPVYEGV